MSECKVSLSIGRMQIYFGDEEAIRHAKAVGADAVDFDLLRYDDTLYKKSDDEVLSHIEKVAKVARSVGIEIGQTHGRITGYRNIPEYDAEQKRMARLDLMATRILGCRHCVMHGPSSIFFGANADPQMMRDLAFRNFCDFLPFARENGVKIATETFGDATGVGCIDFFGDADEFVNIFERIAAVPGNAENFCCCMDTGHTNKAYRFPGEPSPGDLIRRLGKRIEVLHLNDNNKLTDQHKVPRSGDIDWQDVMKALAEIGYDGIYNMELVLTHFGKSPEMVLAYAGFAVKVMRELLAEYR